MEMFPPGLPSTEFMAKTQKYDLSLRFERLAESIGKLESLADAFLLPELKDTRRIHLNSIGIATELKKRTGNDIIPTITLRDSNRQSLLGTIAYGIYAGIENILLVRGDPYDSKSEREPKNVYDFKKISSLVTAVRSLEEHLSSNGRLCIITPINLAKSKDKSYLEVLRKRQTSGVDLFLAEQMFEGINSYIKRIDSVRRAGISLPIIHNIFPLKDYDDAVSCIEKFGWTISSSELRTLKAKGAGFGLEMARKRYQWLLDRKDGAQGVCISTRGDPENARLITS